MISVEEYIKLREMLIEDNVEELLIPHMGIRLRFAFSSRDINTFGDLFDDLKNIPYFKHVGSKCRNLIYDMVSRYLKIEDTMPNEHEAVNALLEKTKLRTIQSAITSLEKQRNEYESVTIQKSDVCKGLHSFGIKYLEEQPAEYFVSNSRQLDFISKCVEEYLNNLAKQLLEEKKSKPEIEKIIQAKMSEFKSLVQRKREVLEFGSEDAAFISKMTAKIGEVRKYKRNSKTHKEEKEHNPFYNDGQTI